MSKPTTIDDYIAGFPDTVRPVLEEVRRTIRTAAPDAQEAISYGMAAFKLRKKPLIYFAGWKAHVGLYALPSGTAAFQAEIAAYKAAKGSVQFPLDQPMPLDLIRRMTEFRVAEVMAG
ncbi:MAG: DUF1801 domain-containing protein [Caulobacteraceae bacterium]